ncbi:MAG: class I SAM-dependent methyltransferase [Bacteroidota bacterium]
MAIDWQKKWNERYAKSEFAYGTEPNDYLKAQLDKLAPGTILFGAEGEGRNGIYAARQGWTVSAFDISIEGKRKAHQFAQMHNVTIDYQVGQLPNLNYKDEQFDAIVLIYAHFPADVKSDYHKLLSTYLKKGGTIIFEAFGKNHLKYRKANEKVGGPRNLDSLFSVEELKTDFEGYEIIELIEKEVQLTEGIYHNGKGSVVRFTGRKPL